MSDDVSGDLDAVRARLDQLSAESDWAALRTQAGAAVVRFPDAPEPALHEGRALLETGAYEEADHHLLLCMDRFPTLLQFAVLYCQVGARALSREDAVERWRTMQARIPDAPGMTVGLAYSYRTAGQLDQAERCGAEGLARWPRNAALLVLHADMAAQRGDWDEAVQRWALARERNAGRLDVMVASVAALRLSGRLDESVALAKQALERFPDQPELNTAIAAAAAERQDWTEVADRLARVLAAAPDNLPAATSLVGALVRLDRRVDAEAAAKAALERHPDDEPLLVEYAALASRAQRWHDAVERWQAVYDRCPPRLSTYMSTIAALEGLERLNEADELACEAVGFAPDDLPLLLKHAWLAVQRLDLEAGKERWTALQQRFPNDERVIAGVAEATATMRAEGRQAMIDTRVEANMPKRGTIGGLQPGMIGGSRRAPAAVRETLPQVGATALDLLLTGRPAGELALPPRPPERGVAVVMRRLFGRGRRD